MVHKASLNGGARLFFDEPEMAQMAAWSREHFAAETAEILRKADEAARGRFLFDCRWDLESCFEPVDFSGRIQWLHQPADDPEWTYSLNRMRWWICFGQAYAVTKDERYAEAFAAQLEDWIRTVRRNDPACAPAWRSIEAGFRLEYWIKAWQYFRMSPSVTPQIRGLFAESIREHADFIVDSYTDFNVISNWGVLAAHGLFMAGILLHNGRRFIRIALSRLTAQLQAQIYRDGMQWEQSPMYHNEVLHDYLDVLILAERNHVRVPAVIRRRTHDMCVAACRYQKPDHHEPMMGDSDDLDICYNLVRGAWFFKDSVIKRCSRAEFDFDTLWDTGWQAACGYTKLVGRLAEVPACSAFLQESGNIIMRSSWEPAATYIRFHCGTLGAGHGHSDQLHIDVSSRGEDILCDSGRFTYVSKPERYEFKNVFAHNTVSVDGADYCRWTGSWSAESFCRPMNQKFVPAAGKKIPAEYAEGGHTGYLTAERGGVLVNRRLVYLKPDILFICDEFFDAVPDPASSHIYEQRWHFSDTGSLRMQNGRFLFTGQRADAALVFADCEAGRQDFSASMAPCRISRHYGKALSASCVTAQVHAKGQRSMAACLFISDAGSTDTACSLTKIPVHSCVPGARSDVRFPDEMIEAWNIRRGSEQFYTVVLAHTEFAAPTDMFNADGCTGFALSMVFDRIHGTSEILLR